MFLSLTVTWLTMSGVGQSTVQKFLAVPDLKAARRYLILMKLELLDSIHR